MNNQSPDQPTCFGVWRPDGSDYQVWSVKDRMAHRVGVGDPLVMHVHHLQLSSADAFRSEVVSLLTEFLGPTDWLVEPMALPPGGYYPRMARPSQHGPTEPPKYLTGAGDLRREYVLLVGQMDSLIAKLQEVCRYVHPEGDSLNAYGDEIRNLLMLACTEVESQWRSVLEANGAAGESTNDFVKLQPAMKLGAYVIRFNRFPWLPPIRPFGAWGTTGKPTKELTWYDAYNSVKHHREANFAHGTLAAALNAVAACAIMMCAQFGTKNPLHAMGGFFSLEETPVWPFPEVYISGMKDDPIVAVNYPFPPSTTKAKG